MYYLFIYSFLWKPFALRIIPTLIFRTRHAQDEPCAPGVENDGSFARFWRVLSTLKVLGFAMMGFGSGSHRTDPSIESARIRYPHELMSSRPTELLDALFCLLLVEERWKFRFAYHLVQAKTTSALARFPHHQNTHIPFCPTARAFELGFPYHYIILLSTSLALEPNTGRNNIKACPMTHYYHHYSVLVAGGGGDEEDGG